MPADRRTLQKLEKEGRAATSSRDPAQIFDASLKYANSEREFIAIVGSDPKTTYNYFTQRMKLAEDSVDLSDESKHRQQVLLCRAFISVFPQLQEAGIIDAFQTSSIFRAACRSLDFLIREEIARRIESPEAQAALRPLLSKADRTIEDIIEYLFPVISFSRRFKDYCGEIVVYNDETRAMNTFWYKVLKNGRDPHKQALFVQAIGRYKDAIKSG